MITKVNIVNFKKLEKIAFDCSGSVVIIGPNNSGKSSVLQALTLWDVGLRKWSESKGIEKIAKSKKQRTGVAINRKDLLNIPVPSAKLLWNKLRAKTSKNETIKIIIDIEGFDFGKSWKTALEFDFSNSESIFCRPVKSHESGEEDTLQIDNLSLNNKIAYLQPMSGLADEEVKYVPGTIDDRIGKGKTADVLRNICYQLLYPDRDLYSSKFLDNGHEIVSEQAHFYLKNGEKRWANVKEHIHKMFGIKLNDPDFKPENGKIELTYLENGIQYDLSSGGRGFLQTLLILSYLYTYPNSVLLLDEPDAHLEVIRQRETFFLINEVAAALNSQLIIASHSEVVLNQASTNSNIIALINNEAMALNDRKSIALFSQSLKSIGWENYFLAKLKKRILYLEGPSDYLMLKAFAKKLQHPVGEILSESNISYLSSNRPHDAFQNYNALKLVVPDLKGIALFDKIDIEVNLESPLLVLIWKRRELENYFATPDVLIRYAKKDAEQGTLFSNQNEEYMKESLQKLIPPIMLENLKDEWWFQSKASETILEPVLKYYFDKIGEKRELFGRNYYELILFLKPEEIDVEITEKLDLIYEVIKPK
jgi:AAA15 family ATPase/GTPase